MKGWHYLLFHALALRFGLIVCSIALWIAINNVGTNTIDTLLSLAIILVSLLVFVLAFGEPLQVLCDSLDCCGMHTSAAYSRHFQDILYQVDEYDWWIHHYNATHPEHRLTVSYEGIEMVCRPSPESLEIDRTRIVRFNPALKTVRIDQEVFQEPTFAIFCQNLPP